MSVHSVIGGNGTIGAVAVRHLAAAGCEVRIVQRHPRLIEGAVATASADVFDLDGLTKAVEGSDVMYLILGLPYDAKVWLEGFPRAVSHAVEAARRVGARLVYFDNVYMYGPVQGVMTEDTPDNPTTQKGLARARAARVLMEAVEKGAIRGLIARSADFYGDYRPFDQVKAIAEKLEKGRKAQLLLRADKVHSLTYIPDAGRAVAVLGQQADAFDAIWHMPTDPNALTGAQLVELIGALLGKEARHTVLPKLLLRMVGLFDGTVRGLLEMSYQFEQDYRVDSSKITQAYGLTATPMRQGLAEHLRFLGYALAADAHQPGGGLGSMGTGG
ncbi:MAG: NAD-dependent epimerase/dehydratase family protein [Chloroflexi bacterium]|jgi:nucleoside-diphosphate-sugar epimerase|nr:NAD-dependent epimerase/dehydratase family protein [Chloroflexota bacterium]